MIWPAVPTGKRARGLVSKGACVSMPLIFIVACVIRKNCLLLIRADHSEIALALLALAWRDLWGLKGTPKNVSKISILCVRIPSRAEKKA